jgi:hypothetical protein
LTAARQQQQQQQQQLPRPLFVQDQLRSTDSRLYALSCVIPRRMLLRLTRPWLNKTAAVAMTITPYTH